MVCAGHIRILGPAEICGENALVGGVEFPELTASPGRPLDMRCVRQVRSA